MPCIANGSPWIISVKSLPWFDIIGHPVTVQFLLGMFSLGEVTSITVI